jgi:hypothetical protein
MTRNGDGGISMHRGQAQTFSTPSPGEILRRQALKTEQRPEPGDDGRQQVQIPLDAFEDGDRIRATRERGVALAPILVKWTYRVADAAPFTKWLRMKEILLSDARLDIAPETTGAHYFGTYLAAGAADDSSGIACETLWGFSRREAMDHFFALGNGAVERTSIVETDLKDFLTGLKGFVRGCEPASFRQSVLVCAQVE